MLQWFKDKITAVWQKILHWSGWSTAGSIFIARMEMLSGVLTAIIAGIDYQAMMALDFTKGFSANVLVPAGLLVAKGFVSEWTRRYGDPNLAAKAV